jgi:hypothetical protein
MNKADEVADEYDVKHSIDGNGAGVTECWLECEDDAVSTRCAVRTHAYRPGV